MKELTYSRILFPTTYLIEYFINKYNKVSEFLIKIIKIIMEVNKDKYTFEEIANEQK